MLRTIIKPKTPKINLSIPADYIGEEIEILIFPIKNTNNLQKDVNDEENLARRQKAFERFTKYRGTLPADFDYKKELHEYRNERYGYID